MRAGQAGSKDQRSFLGKTDFPRTDRCAERGPPADGEGVSAGAEGSQALGRGLLDQGEWQGNRRNSIRGHGHRAVALQLANGDAIQAQRQLHSLGRERIVIQVLEGQCHDNG